MEEITEEEAELVARVAALDIGKAELTACVRVPHEGKPGRRRQEVRSRVPPRARADDAIWGFITACEHCTRIQPYTEVANVLIGQRPARAQGAVPAEDQDTVGN